MALTKSAGRVSIRVLPDSTRFREDLQKFLNRIEKTTRIKIQAEPVVSRTALAKMKRDIQNLAIKITPKIELNISAEDLAELKTKIEALKPVVTVNLNTIEASRRMAVLSRTRTATIVPVIAGAAFNRVFQRLAALGGGNVIADMFRDAREFLDNIDRQAVRLGQIATGVMAIAGSAGALAANMLTLGSNINQLLGLTTLLPAFGVGLALQVTSLVVALKNWKTELAELGPAMTEVGDIINFTFWREARPAIVELVNVLLPALRDGFDKLGTAQGMWVNELANSLQRHVTNERFTTMMDRMVAGINASREAIDPLIHAITLLGLHGSKYFERFGKWITHLSERFDAFITKSFENGDLERWTENAIRTFFDLGDVIYGTYRIFSALTDAAKAAGGPTLRDLADTLSNIADTMERPAFQETMTRIFRGMLSMMGQVGIGLEDLGRGFIAMGPEIETAFKITGTIIRDLLGYMSDFMENPAFQAGFEEFFGGISRGIKNLQPAIEPAATSLGGLLDLLGLVAEQLGVVVAKIATEWTPAFDTIGEELETLVVPISDTLQKITEDLTPVFESLANNVVPPLVDLIENELLPGLEELADWAAPQLTEFFDGLGVFIRDELNPEIKLFREEMKKSGTDGESAFANVLKSAQEFYDFIQDDDDLWGSWFGGEDGEGVGIHIDRITRDLTNFQTFLDDWRKNVMGDDSADSLGTQLNKWVMDGIEALPGLVEGFRGMGEDLDTEFQNFIDEFGRRWDEFWGETIPNSWDEYMEDMKRDLSDWYGDIKQGFQDWMADLMPDWDKFWADLFGEPSVQLEGISGAGFFGDGQLKINEDLQAWLDDMKVKWDEFWGTTFPTAWNDFKLTFAEGWASFWSPEGLGGTITQFFTDVGTNWDTFWNVTLPLAWNTFTVWLGEQWNGFWGGLGTTLSTKWEEFKTTVNTKFEEIKLGIALKIAEIKVSWDTFWTDLGNTIKLKWQQFVIDVRTKIQEIQTSIAVKSAEIQTGWNNFWNVVGQIINTKWEEFKSTVRTKANEIVGNIRQFGTDVETNIRTALINMVATARREWDNLVAAFQIGVDRAVRWVQGLPDRAREALNIDLSGSGAALIQGFINGMDSMVVAAKIKAAQIAQAVRDFFPGSPAKEGPFSGRGWVSYSGEAVVDTFAASMEKRVAVARAAARKVAEAAKIDADAIQENFEAGLEGGGPGDHRTNIFNTYYPVAEKQSRTIEKTSGLIRMKGGL